MTKTVLWTENNGGLPADMAFKNNFAGIAAPLVGNDSTQGYTAGSIWIYNDTPYICVDSTAGAAVWLLLESSGSAIVFSSATGIAAHAGGAKAGATALTKQISRITTVASDGDSVLAPPATGGGFAMITNGHASNGINVYGAGSDTINEIVTANPTYLAPGKTMVLGCALAGAWDGPVTATASATESQPANPTAPANTTTYFMQGLAGAITPKKTGSVLVTIRGHLTGVTTAAGDGILLQGSYGTGAAPANAAALAGTQVGAIMDYTNPATVVAADIHVPFSMTFLISAAAINTPLWLDLAAKSVANASAIGLANVDVTAVEVG